MGLNSLPVEIQEIIFAKAVRMNFANTMAELPIAAKQARGEMYREFRKVRGILSSAIYNPNYQFINTYLQGYCGKHPELVRPEDISRTLENDFNITYSKFMHILDMSETLRRYRLALRFR